MFKKGDKVKIIGGLYKGETGEVIDYNDERDIYLVNGETVNGFLFVENLELVSTDYIPSQNNLNHYLTDGNVENLFKDKTDLLKPNHYQTKNGDLFDEWYERYYNDTKTYTGKEVFVEIMKAVAERYIRRYPNKNSEDIDKGVYTLVRLKAYTNKDVTK